MVFSETGGRLGRCAFSSGKPCSGTIAIGMGTVDGVTGIPCQTSSVALSIPYSL